MGRLGGYRRLLRTTGRAPSDYLRMFGPAPVLINMGVNGLIGMAFILATGGETPAASDAASSEAAAAGEEADSTAESEAASDAEPQAESAASAAA